MAKIITNKKGLDLNLKGKADLKMLDEIKPLFTTYAIEPDNYVGLLPKVLVKEGDKVKVGDPILCHKKNLDLLLTSPVSGEVVAINRGEKRKLLSVEIKSDSLQTYKEFDVADVNSLDREKLLSLLLESGLMSFFRQRPYDMIVDSCIIPRDIFVTANFTAPLAPKFSFLLQGKENAFQTALTAISKLTSGKVFLGVEKGTKENYRDVEQVEIHGPHPSGLVGTLINKTKPINKEETVWTINASDLIVIGKFLQTGKVEYSRTIAITGSSANKNGYINLIPGVKLSEVFPNGIGVRGEHERVIDGNVFTGTKFDESHKYISLQSDHITVIPEGDDVDEMFGWALPGFGKYSMSRSYFSWLMPKKKEYVLDARIKGGQRAMIMSHELNKTFAIDTYPEYLLKAIIAFNITDMENRGIYEVAPEDFSVCEFVDTSKMPLQDIVRKGLDALYKEMN